MHIEFGPRLMDRLSGADRGPDDEGDDDDLDATRLLSASVPTGEPHATACGDRTENAHG